MTSLKTKLKFIAFSFTVLSAGLAVSPFFGIDKFLIILLPKYQNLGRAVATLSDYKYRTTQEPYMNYSLLPRNNVGFKEFLSLIYNKRAIPYDKNKVTHIIIFISGTFIRIGGFEATPQYLLKIKINGTLIGVALMFPNDIQTWVQNEGQDDLQKCAFYSLLFAVIVDFASDFEQKIKEVIMRVIYNYLNK